MDSNQKKYFISKLNIMNDKETIELLKKLITERIKISNPNREQLLYYWENHFKEPNNIYWLEYLSYIYKKINERNNDEIELKIGKKLLDIMQEKLNSSVRVNEQKRLKNEIIDEIKRVFYLQENINPKFLSTLHQKYYILIELLEEKNFIKYFSINRSIYLEYAKRGEYNKASKILETLINKKNKRGSQKNIEYLYYSLSKYQIMAKRYKDAIMTIESYKKSNTPRLQRNLAHAFLLLGNISKAKDIYSSLNIYAIQKDFKIFKKAGIKSDNFEKIGRLLGFKLFSINLIMDNQDKIDKLNFIKNILLDINSNGKDIIYELKKSLPILIWLWDTEKLNMMSIYLNQISSNNPPAIFKGYSKLSSEDKLYLQYLSDIMNFISKPTETKLQKLFSYIQFTENKKDIKEEGGLELLISYKRAYKALFEYIADKNKFNTIQWNIFLQEAISKIESISRVLYVDSVKNSYRYTKSQLRFIKEIYFNGIFSFKDIKKNTKIYNTELRNILPFFYKKNYENYMKIYDFSNAKKELKKILKVQKDNKYALQELSFIYFLQEDKEKFNSISSNMVELFPSEKKDLLQRQKAINFVLDNLDSSKIILHFDKELKEEVSNYFRYFALYQHNLKNYKKATFYYTMAVEYADIKHKVVRLQGLSWCKLFIKDYKGAIESSLKAIVLSDKDNYLIMGINSNLAHAYLLDNQYKKAKEIYLKYKGQYYGDNKTWDSIILKDFKELKENNITHPDMKKIEKLLASKIDSKEKINNVEMMEFKQMSFMRKKKKLMDLFALNQHHIIKLKLTKSYKKIPKMKENPKNIQILTDIYQNLLLSINEQKIKDKRMLIFKQMSFTNKKKKLTNLLEIIKDKNSELLKTYNIVSKLKEESPKTVQMLVDIYFILISAMDTQQGINEKERREQIEEIIN